MLVMQLITLPLGKNGCKGTALASKERGKSMINGKRRYVFSNFVRISCAFSCKMKKYCRHFAELLSNICIIEIFFVTLFAE